MQGISRRVQAIVLASVLLLAGTWSGAVAEPRSDYGRAFDLVRGCELVNGFCDDRFVLKINSSTNFACATTSAIRIAAPDDGRDYDFDTNAQPSDWSRGDGLCTNGFLVPVEFVRYPCTLQRCDEFYVDVTYVPAKAKRAVKGDLLVSFDYTSFVNSPDPAHDSCMNVGKIGSRVSCGISPHA